MTTVDKIIMRAIEEKIDNFVMEYLNEENVDCHILSVYTNGQTYVSHGIQDWEEQIKISSLSQKLAKVVDKMKVKKGGKMIAHTNISNPPNDFVYNLEEKIIDLRVTAIILGWWKGDKFYYFCAGEDSKLPGLVGKTNYYVNSSVFEEESEAEENDRS